MKFITSLVGIAALSVVTSVLAQDEETATPASEQTPSTTIQETPAPTPEAKAGYQPDKGTRCPEKRRARDDACSCKDHAICSGKENERERHVEGQRKPLVSRYRQT